MFNDFNALYAKLVALRTAAAQSGKFKIVFDDQFVSPVVINSGAGVVVYDMIYTTWIGVHEDANVLLNIQDGGVDPDHLTIINALWFEGLTITGTGRDTVFVASANQTFTLTRTTWNGNGEFILDVLGVAGCVVHLDDESRLQRTANAAIRVNTVPLAVHVDGAHTIIDNLGINGTVGGSIVVTINSSSARVDKAQDILLATFTMNSSSGYWNGDPNTVLNATEGTLVSDQNTGIVWRNSNGVTTWTQFGTGGSFAMSPPEKWAQENVAASQTNVALSAQVSTNFDDIKMIRAGSVVGLSTRYTEAITAGTATVEVTINGVGTGFLLASVGGTGSQTTQASGITNYVAGDLVGMRITTTAGFLPITTDLEAWLEVVESA